MSSEFQGTLRRLKPDKHRVQLNPRAESELEFIGTTSHRPPKLLYDTTVYIDILQGRFPQQGEAMLRATEAWHSPVTEGELAATCGLLDPAHSQTPKIIEQVVAVIERRPSYRTLTPDSAAGHHYGKQDHGVANPTVRPTLGHLIFPVQSI